MPMNEFVIPIRKYSQYSFWEPAPQGFSSPKVPVMMEKWQHFSMRENLLFKIGSKGDGLLTIKVVWNNAQVLEEVSAPLHSDTVQFSFKAPSISCKYLYKQSGQMFIRRFQVGFVTGHEFLQTKEVLAKLGFVMRTAVSTRQNSKAVFVPPAGPAFDLSNASFQGMYAPLDAFGCATQASQQALWQAVEPLLSQSTPLPSARPEGFGLASLENGQRPPAMGQILRGCGDTPPKELFPSTTTLVSANTLADIDAESLKQRLQDKEFMRWVCSKITDIQYEP
ncbi:ADR244Wp [Eremothecium gossypii ATCC 10895]|uniref:ADR244Wp n=1 Tax=Eremothecium gossypii (strain ATCC 10895 / CBS 109.51 / FGSC 9923 / NRRL Y-1056) TaxID=284811 RepID=Q759N1_EREGS|nr:ADR244Wp [Eremothecium gossypii ATCC 10895]AAS52164.1 ADR244Wp [Eremothecium gossypii ATCC 10895]AEY96463.1 FADR244Wp [Eremothecium gossypii FDAG1]